MNLLATLLRHWTPGIVRERVLDELVAATARGFGVEVPTIRGLPWNERLAAYARFTRQEAERAIREGRDLDEVQSSLRREAFALGSRTRPLLGIEGVEDTMAVARALYRMIGIDLSGTPEGQITVHSCFFRDWYTPNVCRLISAIDEGVLAGLAGGGRLVFSQRLTDGADRCLACFTREESS